VKPFGALLDGDHRHCAMGPRRCVAVSDFVYAFSVFYTYRSTKNHTSIEGSRPVPQLLS
jgi:hypothetical protein